MNELLCREEAFPELITLSLGVLALLGYASFLALIQYLPVGLFHESLTFSSIGSVFYVLLCP